MVFFSPNLSIEQILQHSLGREFLRSLLIHFLFLTEHQARDYFRHHSPSGISPREFHRLVRVVLNKLASAGFLIESENLRISPISITSEPLLVREGTGSRLTPKVAAIAIRIARNRVPPLGEHVSAPVYCATERTRDFVQSLGLNVTNSWLAPKKDVTCEWRPVATADRSDAPSKEPSPDNEAAEADKEFELPTVDDFELRLDDTAPMEERAPIMEEGDGRIRVPVDGIAGVANLLEKHRALANAPTSSAADIACTEFTGIMNLNQLVLGSYEQKGAKRVVRNFTHFCEVDYIDKKPRFGGKEIYYLRLSTNHDGCQRDDVVVFFLKPMPSGAGVPVLAHSYGAPTWWM